MKKKLLLVLTLGVAAAQAAEHAQPDIQTLLSQLHGQTFTGEQLVPMLEALTLQMQQSQDALEAQLAEAKAEVAQAQQRCADLVQDQQACQAQIRAEYEENQSALVEENVRLTTQMRDSEKNLRDLSERNQSLRTDLTVATQELEQLGAKTVALETSVVELKANVARISATAALSQARAEELEQEVAGKEELQQRLEESTRIAALNQAHMQELTKQVAALKATVAAKDVQLAQLQNEMTDLRAKNDELESRCAAAAQAQTDQTAGETLLEVGLRQEIADLNKANARLVADLATMSQQMNDVTAQSAETSALLRAKVESLETACADFRRSIDAAESKAQGQASTEAVEVQCMREEIAQLRASNADMIGTLAQVRVQLKTASSDLERKKGEVAQAKTEVDALRKDLAMMSMANEKLTKDLASVRQALVTDASNHDREKRALTGKIEALENEIRANASTIDSLKAEIAAENVVKGRVELELARVQGASASATKRAERFEHEKDLLAGQIRALQGEIAALKEEVDQNKSAVAAVRRAEQTALGSVRDLKTELDRVAGGNRDLIRGFDVERNKYEGKISQLERRISELQQHLGRYRHREQEFADLQHLRGLVSQFAHMPNFTQNVEDLERNMNERARLYTARKAEKQREKAALEGTTGRSLAGLALGCIARAIVTVAQDQPLAAASATFGLGTVGITLEQRAASAHADKIKQVKSELAVIDAEIEVCELTLQVINLAKQLHDRPTHSKA